MKGIIQILGFHKMDEMEKYIAAKARRNAYLFLVSALAVWTFYEGIQGLIRRTNLNILPCMLLAASALIQMASRLIMTRNAVQEEDESNEMKPLVQTILFISIAISIMATIAAAILTMGVLK